MTGVQSLSFADDIGLLVLGHSVKEVCSPGLLGRVRDSGIGVAPGFLRPVPCACRSDNGP